MFTQLKGAFSSNNDYLFSVPWEGVNVQDCLFAITWE